MLRDGWDGWGWADLWGVKDLREGALRFASLDCYVLGAGEGAGETSQALTSWASHGERASEDEMCLPSSS